MSKYEGFSKVKLNKPSRSEFDLSHTKRSSTRMGRLTPVLVTECVPSDTFHGGSEILLRLAPLLAPIYDSIQLFVHYFFVPNRLLWEEWETFITGGRLGVGVDPAVAPVPPYFDLEDFAPLCTKSSLADYLGVPILPDLPGNGGVGWEAAYAGLHLDAMPFLAYQQIFMDYYRDRNFVSDNQFEDELPAPSGLMDFTLSPVTALNERNYMHDYFTSALPFTQRGEEVLMPLAGSGSVTYLSNSEVRYADTGTAPVGRHDIDQLTGILSTALPDDRPVRIENIDEVNIENSAVSINDFRSAYALQVWLERNAIGGSRYTESTQAHFGVVPQDSRLQRAEYIGGGRINVQISEVVATAYSDDGSGTVPLGNMGGHGVTYGNTNRFKYFCVEHGFIMGIASIMAPPSYHQGMPRMFRRRTFLDYIWPTFAKLGEQQVDKAELFASGANLTPDANGVLPLFGYQSRYADWKYMCSSNHGDFHDTLLFWTLTREFSSSPVLGANFNRFDATTQDRIFAVNGGFDNFWMYIHNNISVRRPLPYFGTPNTLGFS